MLLKLEFVCFRVEEKLGSFSNVYIYDMVYDIHLFYL